MALTTEHTVSPGEADAEAERVLEQLSLVSTANGGKAPAPKSFEDLATGGKAVSRIMKSVEHVTSDADRLRRLALLNSTESALKRLTIQPNDSLNVQLAKALAQEYHKEDTTARERISILKELRMLYENCRAGTLDSAKALISAAKAAADVSKKMTENDRLQGQLSNTHLIAELRATGLAAAEIAALLGLPLKNVEYAFKRQDEKAAAGAGDAEATIRDADDGEDLPSPSSPSSPSPRYSLAAERAKSSNRRNTVEYGG